MAAVTFHRVSKTYRGGITAIEDLSLQVADGELLVLVGPSGCGKTTALRLIAGLEEPSRGTIALDGRMLGGVPPKDRDVAMVFQSDTRLSPSERVRQPGLRPGRCGDAPQRDPPPRRQRGGPAGIAPLLERRGWELSGGHAAASGAGLGDRPPPGRFSCSMSR